MGDFNGIHDSLNRLLAPFWFTNLYFKQLRPSTRTPSYLDTFILHALSNIVTGNQGLLVLNTNVTVSRNLYWSTLSALIAWPGPWDGRATRRDWIWKVPPPHPSSCPAAILSSTVQQHQHVAEKKEKKESFKDLICPAAFASQPPAQLIRAQRVESREADGGGRGSVSAGGREKTRARPPRLLFGRLFARSADECLSLATSWVMRVTRRPSAWTITGRPWRQVGLMSGRLLYLWAIFFFSPLFFAPISFFIHLFFFFAQCNESFTWLTRLDPFTNLSSLFLVSVRQRAARHMSLPASATKAVLIGRAVPGPSQDGCAGLQAWIVCDLTALQGWSSESPFFLSSLF